ncbi:MAG: NAD(P)/FAD-dependent oxidoreductase [Victivallales bacterium]|nr:NAD(P)/FAD-dependent oxidoreductase [Victivallales bacterium]
MVNSPIHSLVLGAGVGGLSVALLLAKAGRRVTLLEKQSAIGGRLARFHRDGIPFDTGLHFTSSLVGILGQMLTVLGAEDGIEAENFPWLLRLPDGHELVFPNCGRKQFYEYLAQEFPREADALRKYRMLETEVLRNTPMFDLRVGLDDSMMAFSDMDQLPLGVLLEQLGMSPELSCALASPVLYHGGVPAEVPAARHFRVSYGFEEEMIRLKEGGDALIRNFRRELERLGVEVRTSTYVTGFQELDARGQCHSAELSDGTSVVFDDLFSSLHPAEIVPLLPSDNRRGFQRLVAQLEDTCGFFTIFATVDERCPVKPHLVSYLRDFDFNKIMYASSCQESFLSTGCVFSRERRQDDTPVQCLILLSPYPAPPSVPPPSPEEKGRMTKVVLDHFYESLPEMQGRIQVIAAASPHTYARYVPPGRGAYGVRMRVDNPRLMGRLPVRNFYGIGENAFAPGVVGTMLSSFLVARQVLGEGAYLGLLPERAFPDSFVAWNSNF